MSRFDRVVLCLAAMAWLSGCKEEVTPSPGDGGADQQITVADGGDAASGHELGLDAVDEMGRTDLTARDGFSPTDAGTCPAQALAPGRHTLTLQHGGIERSFIVHVPTGYTNQRRVPLVFTLHGLRGNPTQIATSTGMGTQADQAGFVAVFPAGVGNSWNGGLCCGEAQAQDVDDVGFFRAMVADLRSKLCIDKKRVYAGGMSNGGVMSYRLACEASDIFTAIAPVAATELAPTCDPGRPVPIIHFHGTADTLASYASGTRAINEWVARNGCTDTQPTETFNNGVARCETYSPCQGGVEVTLCTVEGGGHCWPGGGFCLLGMLTSDISATEESWRFFQRFALP